MSDNIRDTEIVTPAADAAPVATVVADGLAPATTKPSVMPKAAIDGSAALRAAYQVKMRPRVRPLASAVTT